MGFAIGVCCMMFINVDKEVKQTEKFNEIENLIRENRNTCEDIVEWMIEDVENYTDSTVFDNYIWNLNEVIDYNNYILQSKYNH